MGFSFTELNANPLPSVDVPLDYFEAKRAKCSLRQSIGKLIGFQRRQQFKMQNNTSNIFRFLLAAILNPADSFIVSIAERSLVRRQTNTEPAKGYKDSDSGSDFQGIEQWFQF